MGNRFDSPLGDYSVLYFGTTLETCFGETLARLRPDTKLARLVKGDWSDLGFLLPGEVAAVWRHSRLAVRVRPADESALFLDVESFATRRSLSRRLAPVLAALGLEELDVAAIRGADRRLTRIISYWAWNQRSPDDESYRWAGLRYLSRLNSAWECWALFSRVSTVELERRAISAEMPALKTIAAAYELRIF